MKRLIGFFLVAIAGGAIALGGYKLMEKKQHYYPYSAGQQMSLRPVNYIPGTQFNDQGFETAAAVLLYLLLFISKLNLNGRVMFMMIFSTIFSILDKACQTRLLKPWALA